MIYPNTFNKQISKCNSSQHFNSVEKFVKIRKLKINSCLLFEKLVSQKQRRIRKSRKVYSAVERESG